MKKQKLLYFVTVDWFFCSHWLSLAGAALKAGYDVTVVTSVDRHGERIKAAGFNLIPLRMSRRGVNPFGELLVLLQVIAIYRKIKPDIVHHVAMKPLIYGSIAAWLAGVPRVINAMTGLGFVFISTSLKARLGRVMVTLLYRLLLNRPESSLIFENPDDIRLLGEKGVLKTDRITLIRGAGVDEKLFTVHPEPEGPPLVILASRLLWDKGVGEFVEAARKLIEKGVTARFVLVGEGDSENPASINKEQLDVWRDEGAVELWGYRTDIHDIFSQANIVCLPSYREGVPKVLLEAAACGRAIVSTDVPGCREVVSHGHNGLLVPAQDSDALADALKRLIDSPDLRKQMGEKGRKRVENEFTFTHVHNAVLELYQGKDYEVSTALLAGAFNSSLKK